MIHRVLLKEEKRVVAIALCHPHRRERRAQAKRQKVNTETKRNDY